MVFGIMAHRFRGFYLRIRLDLAAGILTGIGIPAVVLLSILILMGIKFLEYGKAPPRSYYGLNLNFSLANPNINDWLDVNFIRVRATASGMVFASVLCQDIDECRGNREWTINIKLDYSITMEETFGINGAAAAIARFNKPLGAALGGLILGSKISLFTYKVRSTWNNWAEATINELLKKGPTALCKGSQ
jgi:hypothetical protein